MTSLRVSLNPLTVVCLLICLAILWLGLSNAIDVYREPSRGDLPYIVSAGQVVTDTRPELLYANTGPETAEAVDQGERSGYVFPKVYPYSPTFALAMIPFNKMGDKSLSSVWKVITGSFTFMLAVLVAAQFRGWSWRLLAVACVVCWEPLLLNARIGQTGTIVAGLTALGFVVFLRNRKVGAAVLGLLSFKPTAVMAPFFMVFPESPRVWLRFLLVVALIALAPFLWLGPNAFWGWIDILTNRAVIDLAGGHAYNQGITSIIDFKSPVGIFLISASLLVIALAVSSMEKRLDVAATASFTVFLALLLNPHSLLYDWGVAFVGLMLLRRSTIFPERYADACAGALVLTLFLAGQVVWQEFRQGDVLHVLTIWTLVMVAGLLALTLSPSLREGLRTLPEIIERRAATAPQRAPAPEPVAPVSRGSSRAARRKSRR